MKKIKVGYLAKNLGSIKNVHKITINDIMHETGFNIGNMAFWYGASLLFDSDIVLFDFNTKVENIKNKVDILFFPAANWLNNTSNLKNLAEIVKECNVPCILIGLGAQLENENEKLILKEGTLDFIKEVSRRTPFIGVRGKITQKICKENGILNTKVLGCPSILINNDLSLGKKIENKKNKSIDKIIVHSVVFKKKTEFVERELFKIMNLFSSSYIIQRPPELMKLIYNEEIEKQEINYLKKLQNFLVPDIEFDIFIKILKAKAYIPTSVEDWMFYIKNASHAVGTRIHGTIMSISAEIPAICISHDTRTKELTETLKLPTFNIKELENNSFSIKELFSSVIFNSDEFDNNRKYIALNYKNLFDDIGLPISNHLKKIL